MCRQLGCCRCGQQHQVRGDPLGVGPQVRRALERHPVDQVDHRGEGGDRLRRRLEPGRLERLFDQIGVGDHQFVQRQRFGHRAPDPLLTVGRFDQPGQRPARFGHHVRERRVANVELPQRGAGGGTSGPVAVGRQPGHEFARLGSLELDESTRTADHLDRTDQTNLQLPSGHGGGTPHGRHDLPRIEVRRSHHRCRHVEQTRQTVTLEIGGVGVGTRARLARAVTSDVRRLGVGVVDGARGRSGAILDVRVDHGGRRVGRERQHQHRFGDVDEFGDRDELLGRHADRGQPDTDRVKCPRIAIGRQPGRRADDRRRRDDRETGRHTRRPDRTRRRTDQHDGGFPGLDRTGPGPQGERRRAGGSDGTDRLAGDLEGGHVVVSRHVHPVAEKRSVGHAEPDQCGRLCERRGGERHGDRRHDRIGRLGATTDLDRRACLEIDEDVAAVDVTAELDQGRAGRHSPERPAGGQFVRRIRQPPHLAGALPGR